MNWAHVSAVIQRHRFIYAIAGAIVVGLLLTITSMSLYITSGASQLDLSRPGYERARTQVVEPKEDEKFDSSGPINVNVIDEFQKIFTKHRTALSNTDNFDSSVLDDAQLRFDEE